jgi:hypothetical protein
VGTSSHVSAISIGNTHENEATDDTLNAIEAILAGLAPYRLSWGENERAKITPRMLRLTLSRIFGPFGNAFKTEWPTRDSEDYNSLFVTDQVAQPFAPTSIGHRGLAIICPGWTQDDDEGHIFHTFVAVPKGSDLLEYMGDYTKVPLDRKTIEWSLLPVTVRLSLIFFLCVHDVT